MTDGNDHHYFCYYDASICGVFALERIMKVDENKLGQFVVDHLQNDGQQIGLFGVNLITSVATQIDDKAQAIEFIESVGRALFKLKLELSNDVLQFSAGRKK